MTDQMSDSIFVTIKKMLGMEDDYTPFDTDVIVFINTALMQLTQLGVGPKEGFTISDYNEKWSDFLINEVKLGAVKTFVYLKVKMMFDPPTNSFVMDAMKQQAEEIGWRLKVQAESVEKFDFMHKDSLKRGGSPKNIIDIEDEETTPDADPAYNGYDEENHSIDIGVIGGGA